MAATDQRADTHTSPWHLGPLGSYDCETTGTDIETDRIVTAALIRPNGETLRWMSDADGMEIPKAASDIHGVTTQDARVHGRPAKQVIDEITEALTDLILSGAALTVFNAPFDLSLLDRECRRHKLATLTDRLDGRPLGPIVDPLALDRAADRYRKGPRKLEAACAHYGVTLTGAHEAEADAQAALGVALKIAEKYEELQVPAEQLHGWQITWYGRWAAGFEDYLRREGKLTGPVDRSWPVRPWAGGDAS